MRAGRMAGGFIAEWIQKRRLKKAMERRLGREVHDEELISLAAWMETPAAAPESTVARPRKIGRVLIASAGVILLLFAGFAYFFNLGPFSPRPLAGAFPEQVGKFRRSFEPKGFVARTGEKRFSSSYSTDDGSIEYEVATYPSPAAASQDWQTLSSLSYSPDYETLAISPPAKDMRGGEYPGGRTYVTFLDGANIVSVDYKPIEKTKGAQTVKASLENAASSVADFINHLPFAAYGGRQVPTPITLKPPPPMPVLLLLDEFNSNTKGTKLHENQRLFLIGTVAGVGADTSGMPFLAFQKEGAAVGAGGTVAASFRGDQKTAVMSLKKGQEVQFSGIAKKGPVGGVIIEDCLLE